MSTTTTKHGLLKPDVTDFYDIEEYNDMLDAIDNFYSPTNKPTATDVGAYQTYNDYGFNFFNTHNTHQWTTAGSYSTQQDDTSLPYDGMDNWGTMFVIQGGPDGNRTLQIWMRWNDEEFWMRRINNQNDNATWARLFTTKGGTVTGDLTLTGTGWRALAVNGYSANNRKARLWINSAKEIVLENHTDDRNYTQLVLKDESKRGVQDLLRLVTRLDGGVVNRTIFGQHNKPEGTYNGTGTSQEVTVGGFVSDTKMVLIRENYTKWALVSDYGCMIFSENSYPTTSTEIKFDNTTEKLKLSSTSMNEVGKRYDYKIL